MKRFTFLVADPLPVVRSGVVAALVRDGGRALEAADGRAAVQLVQKHRPQLAILEIPLDRLHGFCAAHAIVTSNAGTRVLLFTGSDDPRDIERAMHLRVHGYLLKTSPTASLSEAARAILAGQTWFDPAVREHQRQFANIPGYGVRPEPLSPREQEVFWLIVNSYPNKRIADELQMSVRTVETHRDNLMRKIGATDSAGLVRYAARTGHLRH